MAVTHALSLGKDDAHAGATAALGFRVDVTREDDAVRVCPVGELDLSTVDQLRARIDEAMAAGAAHVILDLRKTTFCDSAALHLVVEADMNAARNGTRFAIIAGPPAVQRIFEVTGLCRHLPFVDVPRG
jgi:anti-anti-sigma factor